MSIFKQIRNSKRCFNIVFLLALALLNGMYSQSYYAMPIVSEKAQLTLFDHSSHQENTMASMHAAHDLMQQNDCMDSDGACKSQCAWHCLLTQAVQPIPLYIDASTVIVAVVPNYQSKYAASAVFETKFRPPISV
jgi:hypothetical protein